MKNIKLYRKRFIPNENIFLKDDIIIDVTDEKIITKWKVLKPRKDFSHGYSCYLLNEGIKISRFYDDSNTCLYIYCDIIKNEFDESNSSYIFTDLLVDVIIYENGEVKVLDIGEISQALDENLITIEDAKIALNNLDKLLSIIYRGELSSLTDQLDCYIQQNINKF